jgi:integrase
MGKRQLTDQEKAVLDAFNTSKKVQEFLELRVSKKSRRHYRYHLQDYFLWLEIIDIDTYIKDTRQLQRAKLIAYEDKLKHDILRYWKFINEESNRFHGKTAYVFISAMKGFLEFNNTVMTPDFWSNIRRSGNGNHSITNYKTPTKQELKEILSNADVESLAIFGMQMTSGQRIEQILDLEWTDVELEHEFPRLFWRDSKGKKAIRSRITPEVKEWLIQYKKEFSRIIETRSKRATGKRKQPLNLNKVFPMNHNTAETKWNNLTKKVDKYILDSVTKKPLYGAHCLRRYFFSNFGNQNDALYFMGKVPENIAVYRLMNDEQLDNIYAIGADNLIIFKEKSETTTLVKEQEQKIKKHMIIYSIPKEDIKHSS